MAVPSEPGDSSSLSLKPVSLNALLDEVLKPLRARLDPSVSVEVRQSSRVPPILGDARALEQLIGHLWKGAVHAMGGKPGLISVMTHAMRLDEAALAALRFADRARAGEFGVFEIDDTGAGMDVESVAETLSPLPSSVGGARATSLMEVRDVIRSHGGALYVESEPGHGLTVQVFLPAAPAEMLAVTEPKDDKPIADTILIADDDDAIRALAKWVVEKAGFKTFTARNGHEALAHFRGSPDSIRLVLLDLSMPRMSGEEVLAGLKEIRPDVEVVLITGHGEHAILESEKQGVTAILQKPFAPDDLRALLKRYTS